MFDINGIVSGSLPIGGPPTGQSIIGAAGTGIVSTDCIDLGGSRDVGFGTEVAFLFRVIQTVAGATSVRFEVIQATDIALTAGIVPRGAVEVPVAQLASGALVWVPVQPESRNIALPRYLGARFTPLGAPSTAGSILGGLSRGYSAPYPASLLRSGFAVS